MDHWKESSFYICIPVCMICTSVKLSRKSAGFAFTSRRQSSKIFHSDNKRRLYSAFLFSNVDTTATHTHDWILSQGPENIPSWNWAIYERPFFHHLNCHPHNQLILLSDVNIVGMEAANFNFAETLGLTTLEVDSLINSSVLVSFAYFTFLCVLCVWELNIKFLFIKFNLLHLCFRLPEIIRDDEQLQHHSRNQGNLTAQSRSLVFL